MWASVYTISITISVDSQILYTVFQFSTQFDQSIYLFIHNLILWFNALQSMFYFIFL